MYKTVRLGTGRAFGVTLQFRECGDNKRRKLRFGLSNLLAGSYKGPIRVPKPNLGTLFYI